jgi:hypothetical protein
MPALFATMAIILPRHLGIGRHASSWPFPLRWYQRQRTWEEGKIHMTFYSIIYLESQRDINQIIKYLIYGALLVAMVIVAVLYVRHRQQSKYRQLGIIMLLLVLIAICGEYLQFQERESASVQNEQMIEFIRNVAKNKQVSINDVKVSSKYLNDGVVIMIGKDHYSVTLSPDRSMYTLERVYLLADSSVQSDAG